MPTAIKIDRSRIVDEVIEAAGGVRALARQLGIQQSSCSIWRQVPAERCLEVERITGISRYRLRPDVYGPDPATARVRARA